MVDYKPIGLEVTGGMGTTALALFNDIVAFAQAAKADKLAPSEWSWSAQGFSSYWMMRISFCVAKITAQACCTPWSAKGSRGTCRTLNGTLA